MDLLGIDPVHIIVEREEEILSVRRQSALPRERGNIQTFVEANGIARSPPDDNTVFSHSIYHLLTVITHGIYPSGNGTRPLNETAFTYYNG